jgi:NCS1 family nucleobase:cation symporter-1
MHDPKLAQEALAELPPDIAGSPLFNPDLAPVPKARRNWSTYNFAALWISMAHCIPTYMLAGGLVAVGMNWWQALLTIGLGNVIVLVPILLNAHPGTQYGIPFPVLARSSFGTVGANVPAVLRAIVACGWFGIQTFIGGEAVKTFIQALWPVFGELGSHADGTMTTVLGLSAPSAITFLLFWALNIFIIFRGMNAVRVFENWAAPIVLGMAAVLLGWVVSRAHGLGPMLAQASQLTTFSAFWKVFIPSLTGMIGFWATLSLNIPDFTRFGRGQREQALGQTLGLPTTMILFSAMGVIVTSASQAILRGIPVTRLWDPVFILSQITSSTPPPGLAAPLIASGGVRALVAVVALLGVGVATISVNIAANVVSPANDFANLAPRYVSFKTGGLITGLLGIVMMPWKLLASADAYIFQWLVGYSALLGPIAGVMIADYWLVRRKQLDVADLYRPSGRYRGMNPLAIGALTAGVLPNIPGFMWTCRIVERPPTPLEPGWRDMLVSFFDAIYPYAWFIGFGVAFAVYLAGRRMQRGEAARVAAGPRPRLVTVACWIGLVWLPLSFVLSFASSLFGLAPSWFVVVQGLGVAVGGACLWAIWRMQRWGVALYLGFAAAMQVVLITGGQWRVGAMIVPALVLAVAVQHYREMADGSAPPLAPAPPPVAPVEARASF